MHFFHFLFHDDDDDEENGDDDDCDPGGGGELGLNEDGGSFSLHSLGPVFPIDVEWCSWLACGCGVDDDVASHVPVDIGFVSESVGDHVKGFIGAWKCASWEVLEFRAGVVACGVGYVFVSDEYEVVFTEVGSEVGGVVGSDFWGAVAFVLELAWHVGLVRCVGWWALVDGHDDGWVCVPWWQGFFRDKFRCLCRGPLVLFCDLGVCGRLCVVHLVVDLVVHSFFLVVLFSFYVCEKKT